MRLRRVHCGVEIPAFKGHPNRLPFRGMLVPIDVPSNTNPGGSRGHRIVLTREAAIEALPSLVGMGVNYKDGWSGHDVRQKCGVITSAHVTRKGVMVGGFLYELDFKDIVREMSEKNLGMSVEMVECHVTDMRAAVYEINSCVFTGAAILDRDTASFRGTSFELCEVTA